MPSISYNGEVVDSVVSKLQSISKIIPSLSSEIKSATNQIISAKGFQKYVGGISSDSFSGAVDKCQDEIGKFTKEIRQKQVSVLAYSEDGNEINAFLDKLSRSEYDSLDLSEINSYIGLDRKAGNILKGVGSTVATFGLSLFEGLGELLETGADLVVLGVSGAATIFTGAADLITGGHNTKDLWENTKAFVSDKKVENIFNSLYSDTEVGQYLKENAYVFDGARSVGTGVGYTVGLIGLNVLTGGLSSGLGVGAAGSITPAGLATSAGVLGFSRGTEDAWADGATIENGLMYGAASGAWEGLQWYAGAKINQYGGLGDKVAQGIFKGAAKGVGTRIAMDTVDSALEGFVQPALTMIYKDYGEGSFIDNYKTAFNQAGGWANVGTHAVMGGIASTVGEYFNARRLLKAANLPDDGIDDAAKQVFESDGGDGSELVQQMRKNVDQLTEENGKNALKISSLDDALDTTDDELLRKTKLAEYAASDADAEMIFEDSSDKGGFFSKFKKKKDVVDLSSLDDELDSLNKELLEKTKVPTIDASSADAKMIFGESADGGNGLRSVASDVELMGYDNELMGIRDAQGKEIFFGRAQVDGQGRVYQVRQHIDPVYQEQLTDNINQAIRNQGEATFTFKSTKELTSEVLEGVEDLSKLKVKIEGGFADLDGNYRAKYTKEKFVDRVTYTGYEALGILKRMEGLEAQIDMSLPPTERAKQIGDIVASEYRYSHAFEDESLGYSFTDRHNTVASLRGMTSNNMFGEEGLVCAGYAQVYKELCERADLQCDYVRGTGISPFDGSRDCHVWNVVIGTDGDVIPVDCTEHAGGVQTWFGQSEQFNYTHIADADEVYRSYAPTIYTTPKNDKIAYMKDAMDYKYGPGAGDYGLMSYLATGNDSSITNSWNARGLLGEVSTTQIEDYFLHTSRSNRTDAVMKVIRNTLQQQYGSYGDQQFSYFLQTGDTDFFPIRLKEVAEKYLTLSDLYSYNPNY